MRVNTLDTANHANSTADRLAVVADPNGLLSPLFNLEPIDAIVVADRAAEVGFTDLECGQGGHVRGILAGVGLISEGLTLGGPFGNASPSGPFDLVSPGWMSLALWNPGWFFAFFPGPASWRGANSVRLNCP